MEKWRVFNEMYLISDFGRVKSLHTNRILKPALSDGYHSVILTLVGKRKYHSIHRMVATVFIDNPYKKPQVNHKDGVKTNNHVSNLEWVTPKGNIQHSWKNGLSTPAKMEGKPVIQLSKYGLKRVAKYKSVSSASKKTGISKGGISGCCNKKTHHNTAGGYRWEWAS